MHFVAKLAFSVEGRVGVDAPASSHIAFIRWGSTDRSSFSAALMIWEAGSYRIDRCGTLEFLA